MNVPEWKKNLAVLWSVQVIGMGAINGVVSFLPLYVPHLGVSRPEEAALWSGILIGAASFCAALSNPYWGAVADRRGRKVMVEKVMLLFGLIMIAMSFVTSVYQLLALRLFQGLCGGFSAIATALAVSLSPPDKIADTLGIFQAALIVGGAVGPMAGGLIADFFGYHAPFRIFGGLCLLTLVILRFKIKETFAPKPQTAKPSLLKTLSSIWSLKEIRLMLLVQFLAQFAVYGLTPVLPLYIQTLAPNQANIASISGTLIAVAGLSSAAAAAGMGFFCKRFSHRQILVTASLLGGLSFIGQLAAADLWTLGILRAVNGLCIGALIPSSNTIVAALIPESKRGAAFGVTSGAALMGNVLGPLSAGFFSVALGMLSIFWITASLFLLVSLLLFRSCHPAAALEAEPPA